jgi:hypothetical protein
MRTKMKREHEANKSELPREEWDFQSVLQSEIETCFIYEYARELVRRSPRILNLRAELKASWTAKTVEELIKTMDKCFPDFPVVIFGHNWFPDIPWQRLDDKLRSELVKETTEGLQHYWKSLPSGKLHIQTLRRLETANIRSLEAFRHLHEIFHTEDINETEYGFFAINWSYTDAEIRRTFEQWLSEERQGRKRRGLIHIARKPRGRGGFRDQLNCLGALRVREHYPRKQLADDPYPRLKISAPPYSNLPDLYEAAKKARELLGKLLQMAERS